MQKIFCALIAAVISTKQQEQFHVAIAKRGITKNVGKKLDVVQCLAVIANQK